MSPGVRDDQSLVLGSRKYSMCHLSNSRQIHQREVDNVRRKYLQMNGIIADPLQRDKKKIDVYGVFNSSALFHRHVKKDMFLKKPFGGVQSEDIIIIIFIIGNI